MTHNDYPLEELLETANKLIAKGDDIYLKWTCSACGERIMAEQPNTFYHQTFHEDCPVDPKAVTDLDKQGGNYMVVKRL